MVLLNCKTGFLAGVAAGQSICAICVQSTPS
jgi:hypothetical protein